MILSNGPKETLQGIVPKWDKMGSIGTKMGFKIGVESVLKMGHNIGAKVESGVNLGVKNRQGVYGVRVGGTVGGIFGGRGVLWGFGSNSRDNSSYIPNPINPDPNSNPNARNGSQNPGVNGVSSRGNEDDEGNGWGDETVGRIIFQHLLSLFSRHGLIASGTVLKCPMCR
jgi:hypothetical protein